MADMKGIDLGVTKGIVPEFSLIYGQSNSPAQVKFTVTINYQKQYSIGHTFVDSEIYTEQHKDFAKIIELFQDFKKKITG